MTKNRSDRSGPERHALESPEQANAEAQGGDHYSSGLIPLLWLGIPFILVLLYGLLG